MNFSWVLHFWIKYPIFTIIPHYSSISFMPFPPVCRACSCLMRLLQRMSSCATFLCVCICVCRSRSRRDRAEIIANQQGWSSALLCGPEGESAWQVCARLASNPRKRPPGALLDTCPAGRAAHTRRAQWATSPIRAHTTYAHTRTHPCSLSSPIWRLRGPLAHLGSFRAPPWPRSFS